MSFKGYVDLENTLYFLFTTRQFSTGAPFTLAATPVLSVYEENNLTQITAGVSISADYDSVTGLNQATVVATAANGYEAGKRYEVVITTGTVDSVSVVGEVVATFAMGNVSADAKAISGDATAADNLELACDNYSVTRGLTGTALPAVAADGAGGVPVSDAGGLDIDAKLANTNEVTVARMGALTDWINGGRLDLLLDAIPTTAMRGTDSAALASVCTEGRLAELDAANLPADVDAIPTTAMRGTDSAALASVCTEGRLAELDAANIPADIDAIPTTAMRGTDSAALASVCTEGRLAELDAANLPADIDALTTAVAALPDAAAINAQVLDVLNVDTFAEPGQEVPTSTTTLVDKIGYLYKFLRNRITQSATELKVYDDAGTTVDQKSTVSDDGTTFTRGEIGTGP